VSISHSNHTHVHPNDWTRQQSCLASKLTKRFLPLHTVHLASVSVLTCAHTMLACHRLEIVKVARALKILTNSSYYNLPTIKRRTPNLTSGSKATAFTNFP